MHRTCRYCGGYNYSLFAGDVCPNCQESLRARAYHEEQQTKLLQELVDNQREEIALQNLNEIMMDHYREKKESKKQKERLVALFENVNSLVQMWEQQASGGEFVKENILESFAALKREYESGQFPDSMNAEIARYLEKIESTVRLSTISKNLDKRLSNHAYQLATGQRIHAEVTTAQLLHFEKWHMRENALIGVLKFHNAKDATVFPQTSWISYEAFDQNGVVLEKGDSEKTSALPQRGCIEAVIRFNNWETKNKWQMLVI